MKSGLFASIVRVPLLLPHRGEQSFWRVFPGADVGTHRAAEPDEDRASCHRAGRPGGNDMQGTTEAAEGLCLMHRQPSAEFVTVLARRL